MFNWFRKRPVRSEETSRPDKAPKSKKFKFSTISVEKIGDIYSYEITADSREEGQRLLINYFYGDYGVQGVESEHHTIHYPLHSRDGDVLNNDLFPSREAHMFAKCLAGLRIANGVNYRQWLLDKAAALGVTLKEGRL